MEQNVLVVSVSAPPQNSPESLQVAKYLKYLSASWKITLVTIKSAGGWRRADDSLNINLAKIKQIIRLPHFTSGIYFRVLKIFFRNSIVRPDQDFLFFYQWKRAVKAIKDKPSLIYSRSTPFSSSIMALRLKKHYNVPWVMHLSDPWSISPHFAYTGSVRMYHEAMELECIKYADIVSLTSYETIDAYKSRYPQYADKFRFFSNVYNDEELTPNPFQFNGKLRFVYAGNFYGEGRSPEFLLRAIKQIVNGHNNFFDNAEFIFIGRFNKDIQDIFNAYNFSFIKIRKEYSFEDSVSEQRNGHVMILIDWKFEQEKSIFFLSKILGYMASQRTILAITEKGSTCYNVIEGKYGHCYDHYDTDGIAAYLTNAVNNYQQKNLKFFTVENPDPAYSSQVNTDILSTLFATLLS
jgi:glycosyltransferase involved in cell wall biosynthesis